MPRFIASIHSSAVTNATQSGGAAPEAELFRLLAENVLDYAVFVIDSERRVRTWSVGAERLLGYVESEILGKSSDLFFTPEDRAAGQPEHEVRQALIEGRGEDDRWHVKKDGTRFWSAGVLTPLRDRDGRLHGFCKIMRDQTALKLAEEARHDAEERLRQSEQRFRGLMDQAPFSIQIFAADGRTVGVNRAWEELWGVSADKVGDYNVLQDPQLEAAGTLQYLRRAFRGEPAYLPEIPYDPDQTIPGETRHADPLRWVAAIAFPVKDAAGNVREVVLMHEDVTARRKAEEAFRGSEEWRRLALDAGRMGTWEWEVQTGRIRWSENLEAIHGLPPGSFDGTFEMFRTLIHPDDLPAMQSSIEGALTNRTTYEAEFRFVRPGGRVGWMAARGRAYYGDDGLPTRMVGVDLDVTARKDAERQLVLLSRVLENMAEGVSVSDERGYIVYTNRAEDQIFGYGPGELIGRHVTEQNAYPPEENEARVAEVISQLQTAGVWTGDFRNRRKDGFEFTTACRISALGLDGQTYFVCVQEDVTEHRKTEEDQRRLTLLVENSPDFIGVADADQRTMFLNRAGRQLVGLDGRADEGRKAEGTPILDYFIDEDRERVEREILPILLKKGSWQGEVRFRHFASGEAIPVGWNVFTIPDPQTGAPAHFAYVSRDLREQKRAEAELERRTKLLNAISDNADSALVMVDVEGRLTFVNPAFCRITGYSSDEAVGRAVHNAVHYKYPDGRPFPIEECPLDSAYRKRRKAVRGHEDVFVRKDGSLFPIVASVAPLEEDGAIVGCVAEFRDVTSEKAALVRSEQVSRFLAEAGIALAGLTDYESTLMKVAVLAVPHFADWCTVDMLENGTLRRVAVAHTDPAKVELAQEYNRRYPADPAAPQGVWNILRTGQPELVSEITDEFLEAAVQEPERLARLRELGLKSYVGVPLRVRDAVLGVLTFIADESGRRFDEQDLAAAEELARRAAVAVENVRLYAEVQTADRRKDEFLAMLGHELRNPLAPIRSGLDLLRMSAAEPEVVDLMSGQVEHLVRLVDDLLDVSRILRGRVELKRTAVDLSEVVRRAVETVRPMFTAERQEFTAAVPTEPLFLDCDPVRLSQVLTNLLMNASKYTESGGRISLSAERDGGQVVVRVSDTGIGIDPDLLPHVFELFTQSTRAIDRSQGGLGIGLTIVKSLVEMHGGSVVAESGGPGQGSTFTVRLPTTDVPGAVAASTDEGPLPAGRRILVVDDNVPAAKLLVRLLAKFGPHEIVTAHDGEGAIAAAEAYRPQLILLDIGLPKLDGYEVSRRLRSNPAFDDVLLVALTGYGTDADRRRSLDAGFDEHVTKPPSVEMLQKVLKHPKLSGR